MRQRGKVTILNVEEKACGGRQGLRFRLSRALDNEQVGWGPVIGARQARNLLAFDSRIATRARVILGKRRRFLGGWTGQSGIVPGMSDQ